MRRRRVCGRRSGSRWTGRWIIGRLCSGIRWTDCRLRGDDAFPDWTAMDRLDLHPDVTVILVHSRHDLHRVHINDRVGGIWITNPRDIQEAVGPRFGPAVAGPTVLVIRHQMAIVIFIRIDKVFRNVILGVTS